MHGAHACDSQQLTCGVQVRGLMHNRGQVALHGEVKASLGSLEYIAKSCLNKVKQHMVPRPYSLKLL